MPKARATLTCILSKDSRISDRGSAQPQLTQIDPVLFGQHPRSATYLNILIFSSFDESLPWLGSNYLSLTNFHSITRFTLTKSD
jgi:hypothetical protein